MNQDINSLFIASRRSELAIIQAKHVSKELSLLNKTYQFSIVTIDTLGDLVISKPLYQFDGNSLWTKELEKLMVDKRCSMAVHSLKDLPTNLPDGFVIGAILERLDPRDALVVKKGLNYKCLKDLPEKSIVGTSSIRRIAQLRRNFPMLLFKDIRGNVTTRIKKLDDPKSPYTCLILASAGLLRLGLGDRIVEKLESPILLHAAGQGAIGVEVRCDDIIVQDLLKPLNHTPTLLCCLAERSLMSRLEGGCSIPIGIQTKFDGNLLKMESIIVSLDGTESVSSSMSMEVLKHDDAVKLGILLADDLIKKGALEILYNIKGYDPIKV
ncbi:porphobilinogen deaminase [Pneumocystis jirovecii RU7]|uniref:Porphobilinogen deaminase n=1 Tax=Pneumocystis jirovecii (strain RU7) TaxID=1408657 RepID=A0A0W4ZNJ2_PNEJ7|nr:porphobilinogen deaminase [Pneumocystis jirovecii RU7]KTW29937.1 porphobilinogen deaminase [Pneumocystis jirovecii RU7]